MLKNLENNMEKITFEKLLHNLYMETSTRLVNIDHGVIIIETNPAELTYRIKFEDMNGNPVDELEDLELNEVEQLGKDILKYAEQMKKEISIE